MNASTDPSISTPRHKRLSAATDELHEQIHALVAKAAPFTDAERYRRFALVQYRFQAEIDGLYRRPGLQAIIPDLASRSRLSAAAADLEDLGVPLPATPRTMAPDDDEALGWLFVSEGSRLGAAILSRHAEVLGLSATFGARYLAGPAEGRGRHWQIFTDAIDALDLDAAREAQVEAGARAAFQRFAALFSEAYGL